MRTWRMACGTAVLVFGLATAAHADEWTKLTYLTFSGPVNMPGITLPAGTYRFELMDPDSSRRVIRVSDKGGTTNYGIFLTISDQRMPSSDEAVVMFKETPKGAPQAIRAWFYPGETTGYEFVYPRSQAMTIARATHASVLSMNEPKETTTEADRVASMRGAEIGRIDEYGKPTAASSATTTARPRSTTGRATASEPTTAPKAASDTAPAPRVAAGTTGTTTTKRHLPRTASPLPLIAILGGLLLAGGLGVRAARKSMS